MTTDANQEEPDSNQADANGKQEEPQNGTNWKTWLGRTFLAVCGLGGIGFLIADVILLGQLDGENTHLTANQMLAIIFGLMSVLLVASGSALFVAYHLASDQKEKALGLIALVVAPMLTVITALANNLGSTIQTVLSKMPTPTPTPGL